MTRWLADRAADAPENFLHLQRLLEAERAWAIGDFRGAAVAFDRALRDPAQRARPWHRAMIAERAARFALSHGLDHAGHRLLADARRQYAAWGAAAKVEQLDQAYATLEADAPGAHEREGEADPSDGRTTVTAGTIELRRTAEEPATSRARIVATADETRRRIVRDLHDGAQNRLVQVILTLALAERARDADDPEGAGERTPRPWDWPSRPTPIFRELSHGILPSALAREASLYGRPSRSVGGGVRSPPGAPSSGPISTTCETSSAAAAPSRITHPG